MKSVNAVECSSEVMKPHKKTKTIDYMKRHVGLYMMVVLPLVYLLIFKYLPMFGISMAFLEFDPVGGYATSKFVGFDNFIKFFNSRNFWTLIRNTLSISLLQLVLGFPLPIILALSLNEMRSLKFKKTIQMITYAPHFISTVVMVSIIMQFLDPHNGIINSIVTLFGGEPVNYLGRSNNFNFIYVLSGMWQNMGFSSIIYIAALSGLDPQMEEAAIVDGASKFQKIIHIDLPSIMPTAIVMLILESGKIMSVGFEKVFLLQNSGNISASEIISTYVYKIGILNFDFSYSTTVGLFNSIVNLILILVVNKLADKYSNASLF